MTAHEVLVIGGGPAGSTAATILAQRGVDVCVLERETFPRFRIGESLLPCDLPIFERMGFDPSPTDYVRKNGAIFHHDDDQRETTFSFAEGLPGTPPHAWQVERAKFDAALLDCAKRAGARVDHGIAVSQVDVGPGGVTAETDRGLRSARYLIDATGPKAFMGRHKRAIEPISGFGIAAVFAHWAPIDEAIFAELTREGHITVLIESFGWGWVIPIAGRKLSVGFVTKEKNVGPELYWETLERSRYVKPLLQGATPTEPQTVGNFSFLNRAPSGSRYACVGDAAAFLDPVFSSGVSLGMLGGERTADCLVEALQAGQEDDPTLMAGVGAHMRRAYESFGSLIHRFYNTKIVDHVFFHPEPDRATRAGIISVLAGDVWRTDNDFQNAILKGRHAWNYDAPGAAHAVSRS